MKYSWKLALIVMLPAVLAGCTDESLPTSGLDATVASEQADGLFVPINQFASPAILHRFNRCNQTGCVVGKNAVPASFTSPLFALATAPNQDVLVADAGVGVVSAPGSKSNTAIAILGVTGVAPIGRGAAWASVGSGADPGANTGQALYRVSNGTTKKVADLFAFEEANNPEPSGALESNPFDVQAIGRNSVIVADAAANDLLRVDNRGNVSVVAIFPPTLVSTDNIKSLAGCPSASDFCGLPSMMPAQSVPTSVAIGQDGYYYVGELRGFPAPTNESSIWRVSPNADGAVCGSSPECVKVFDGGFTSIIDLAFSENGHLLVAELDEASWLAVELSGPSANAGTVNSCDVGTLVCTEVATGIPMLTAITETRGGAIWATRNALIPGLAEVVQIN